MNNHFQLPEEYFLLCQKMQPVLLDSAFSYGHQYNIKNICMNIFIWPNNLRVLLCISWDSFENVLSVIRFFYEKLFGKMLWRNFKDCLMSFRKKNNLDIANIIKIELLAMKNEVFLKTLLWGVNEKWNTKPDKCYPNDSQCFKILQYFWKNDIVVYKGKYIELNNVHC